MLDRLENRVVENTARDRQRHEEMRIRNTRYGFFPVAKNPIMSPKCVKCQISIHGERVLVNGKLYHYECFG